MGRETFAPHVFEGSKRFDLGSVSQRWIWIDWCEKNISPRQFWLHSNVGGEGWSITFDSKRTILHVPVDFDDRVLTFALLQLTGKK